MQFVREQIIRPMYFNAWATDQGSELESKKDALEVQRIAEQKQLDSLLALDVSNPSITAKIGVFAQKVSVLDEQIDEVE
ncbi:hypothetical protein JCM19236_439 [Vibrio sp. JCM 19236]|nr:hypothetical protein JCM19236_439 [Vibrio sp. JCM 19236]